MYLKDSSSILQQTLLPLGYNLEHKRSADGNTACILWSCTIWLGIGLGRVKVTDLLTEHAQFQNSAARLANCAAPQIVYNSNTRLVKW